MLSHLHIVLISKSSKPAGAAVDAAPAQKMCPEYLLYGYPKLWSASLTVLTKDDQVRGDPLLN